MTPAVRASLRTLRPRLDALSVGYRGTVDHAAANVAAARIETGRAMPDPDQARDRALCDALAAMTCREIAALTPHQVAGLRAAIQSEMGQLRMLEGLLP